MKSISIITGPTAIGKSKYALDLAEKTGAEIISMDAIQVYNQMDIGTAKPSPAELAISPHHLISLIAPDQTYSVVHYINDVKRLLEENPAKKFIIVGGTGLYLNALLSGLDFPLAKPNEKIRSEIKKEIELKGSPAVWEKLKKVDNKACEKITPNDAFRIIRALEVYKITGKPISQQQKKDKTIIPKRKVTCLTKDREKVYLQIGTRVEEMIEKGLVREVEGLLNKGYQKKLPSLQAIGYKEIIQFLEKEISLDQAIEKIKKGTRNFAKRQYTWFRRFNEIEWLDVK